MVLSLGYAPLKRALQAAYRKGRVWRRSRSDDKGLLRASVAYTKLGRTITDVSLLARLRLAFRRLRITNHRVRVLIDGELRAHTLLTALRRTGVFRWAPQLNGWLHDAHYKFWLGTHEVGASGPWGAASTYREAAG